MGAGGKMDGGAFFWVSGDFQEMATFFVVCSAQAIGSIGHSTQLVQTYQGGFST